MWQLLQCSLVVNRFVYSTSSRKSTGEKEEGVRGPNKKVRVAHHTEDRGQNIRFWYHIAHQR